MKQLVAIVSLWVALALPGLAQPFEEGTHYTRLADPVPVRQPSRIEVAEVFSYACGHCFTFEPLIREWKSELPDDVYFVDLHVQWDRATENLARALYTAKALGVMDEVHPALFRAIHVEGKRLQNQTQIAELFVRHGVDREEFDRTFQSFGVTSQLKQGESKIAGARVSGTPSLLVHGRYLIKPSEDVNHETMLDVAEYLVGQIREERGN